MELPNVIELLSYTLFTQQSVVGVFFEFSDYKNFIEKAGPFKNTPSPIIPSLISLGEALLYTIVFTVGN